MWKGVGDGKGKGEGKGGGKGIEAPFNIAQSAVGQLNIENE